MLTATEPRQETKTLQCMEIWGGNEAIDSAISVPGIDAWITSKPYAGDTCGGDVHFISLCGGSRIARFVIADVSGHGRSAGALAHMLRGLIRKHINQLDQTKLVRALNEEFSALEAEGQYATALTATYFAPTDHLIVCNAGHPVPLWYRAETGTWRKLAYDLPESQNNMANLPIGVIEPTSYYQFAVPLDKGDMVLIFTDSLIEARNADDEELGEQGLLGLVRRISTDDPGDFTRLLLDEVAQYRGQRPPDDDLTALLLHHNTADPPRQSLGDKLTLMGKMLGIVKV